MKWYAIDDQHPEDGERASAAPAMNVYAEYCNPGEYEWRVEIVNGDDPFSLARGHADTLAFAKSCAESFLRGWVARQAAALGITRIEKMPHTYLEIQYKNPNSLHPKP